ncbi:MAG: M56 family metallopeptidase [Gemmatimonadota bacterium]|nr:M56 family metallopeptidase [Gemmatimonadota bacterium]
MSSNFLATLGGSAASNIPMAMLLAKATIILLLALGMTIVMQRASAGARHLVWLVTVAALLLVPALTAWAPLPVRVLPAVRSIAQQTSPLYGSKHEGNGTLKSDEPYRYEAVTAASAPREPTPSTNALSRMISGSALRNGISMLFLVWVAVMLVIATSLGYAALVVRRIVHRARPLDSTDWLNPLWEVSDRLALEEPPRLLRSEDAKMPFACGLFQATIVLPAECDNWSLDRRRAVLLHELAHVRRHDLIGHTLGRLACAVYWFHPLVWTAAKRLRSESERACDDLALACGARATDYAEHLLDIVTSVRRDATPSVALAMARRKEFEGRMLAILDPELRHSSPSRRQSATLIASVAVISIVVGAAAPAPRVMTGAQAVASRKAAKDFPSSPTETKIYPDSYQIIGGSRTHTNTQTVVSQAEHTTTNTAEHTASSQSYTWVDKGASAAAAAATAMPAGLLRVLTQRAPKGNDERPALLAKILSTDTSPTLRRIAAWGLAEYADSQVAADALASALRHDANADVREMAAWALGDANKSSAAVEALSAALRGDANVQVRALSAWALGNVGDRSSTDVLVAALSDASPEVRKRALWAIGNSGPKQAPRAVIALLSDGDPEVRELAAWVLFEIEDPTAIPALEAALRAEKNNKNLQIAYIKALAATGEKSVDALRSLLESPDHEIKSIAVRALAGGNATGPWPWPWPEPRPFP